MGIKYFKPTSPGQRFKTVNDFAEITTDRPHKSLLRSQKSTGGRDGNGHLAVWHRGGGHKRRYRLIDFKRNKIDIPGKVKSIEYDPNRSVFIALICYADGEYRYILSPAGIKVGEQIIASEKAEVKVGNALPLENIPVGTVVHNIEMTRGRGGQIARAAGSFATISARVGDYVILKMPSSEVRKIHVKCWATVGILGNKDNSKVKIGKAGRARWMGKRPEVRGVVMNPVDHPHGGGEGKTSGGRHPVSRTGVPAKGYKTRKKHKSSDKLIISRRKK